MRRKQNDVKYVEEKDLSSIQKANMEMSLAWKKASYELIMNAWKGKDEDRKCKLEDAIIWCGEKGHAISRISKTDRAIIVSRLIDALKKENDPHNIVFDKQLADSCVRGCAKKYYSWVSKVCHILNPHCNHFAFDSTTRVHFKINKHYGIDEWLEKSNIYWNDNGLDLIKMDRTTAYLYDCYVWAFHGKKWKDR